MKIEEVEGRELERQLLERANHTEEDSLSRVFVPYKGQTSRNKNFVTEYAETIGRRTDSPTSFHRLTAWVILSTVVGREPYVNLSYGQVHLNLWGMVLGKSSATRKSTAIKKGRDTLREACPNLLFPNRMSQESMWRELGNGQKGLFYRDEYAGFLADTKKDYMRGTRESLAEIYDSPNFWESSLMKGTFSVKDAYMTHLTGTTIDRFRSEITPLDIESGFAVRFLYAFEDESNETRKPVGRGSDKFTQQDKGLMKRLQFINAKCGKGPVRLDPTDDALKAFNDWYVPESKQTERSDPLLSTLFERYQAMTWKFAGLIEIQRAKVVKSKMDITEKSVSDAIDETEYWLEHGKRMIDAVCSVAPQTKFDKAIHCARRHSVSAKISRSMWLRMGNLTAKELDSVVEAAKSKGLIKEMAENGAVFYELTNSSSV